MNSINLAFVLLIFTCCVPVTLAFRAVNLPSVY